MIKQFFIKNMFFIINIIICIIISGTVYSQIYIIGPDKPNNQLEHIVKSHYLPNRTANIDHLKVASQLADMSESNPENEYTGEGFYMAGILYSKVAQWDKAIGAFHTAIQSGKLTTEQTITALFNVAQCQKYKRDYLESINTFKTILFKIDHDTEMHDILYDVGKNNHSPYFDWLYKIIVNGHLEIVDSYIAMNQFEKAAESNLLFFEWFNAIHDEKEFFNIDNYLGLDSSSAFIEYTADLYLNAPGMIEKATEIYGMYLNHWTVNNNERIIYECRLIRYSRTMSLKSRIAALQKIIETNQGNKMLPVIKHWLAHYAKKSSEEALYIRTLIDLSNFEHESSTRFKPLVQIAVQELAMHYLRKNDAAKGEQYLERLKNEFKNSLVYKISDDMQLWKWPAEIRNSK